MNAKHKSIILAISLFFTLSASISAAPGDLDPTFGSGGIVLTSFAPDQYWYDSARTVRVQPDGKIVVCGWISDTDNNGDRGFFLARYHPTGALDASFGTNGKIIGPINSGEMVGNDIALQPDGKIIAVGYGFFRYGFAVHRYNANGTLDASFGAGGVVITPFAGYGASVALQPDGKIVVAGSSSSSGQSYEDFTVVRLLLDGSLDTSFGGTGKVITSFGNRSYAGRVIVQPDGKIVAVGSAYVGNNQGLALVRYNSDGSLDSGFGSGGKIIHGVFNVSLFSLGDAVLQPDGKIIASGHFSTLSGGGSWDSVFRCNPDGSRDWSFAFLSADNLYIGNAIALQTDGKPVFFGYENSGGNYRFAILRLNPNGVPDTGFGTNGRVFTQIGSSGSGAVDGALQPDGKILALGVTSLGFTDNDIAIVRYLGDAPSACPNPIDCPDFFVRQHYRDFLSRESDVPGQAHWTNEITMCSDSANRFPSEAESECIDRKRTNTSGAFYLSNEFQNSANFLIRVNWGSLGKDRAIGRKCIAGQHSALDAVCRPLYSDYLADMARLTQGIVVNDALDPNVINTNKRNFVTEFVNRPDFLAAYPNTMAADAYVDKLSQTTGIALTVQERSDLINKVGTEGRAAVLFDMVDGTITIAGGQLVFNTRYGRAFYDQEFNPAFVFVQYLAYLRRNPDQAGFEHWLGKLNFFGNFVDAEMVRAFIVSEEYRTRFGMP